MNESSNDETLTFIVRLWRESSAGGSSVWRGRVEHVASQEVEYVENVAGIGRFIARWVEAAAIAQVGKNPAVGQASRNLVKDSVDCEFRRTE